MSRNIKDIRVFYENDTAYELTVNPNDKCQHFGASLNRLRLVYTELLMAYDLLSGVSEFTLFPEISEPQHGNISSSQPRIHFHGIIKFNNVGEFLLNQFYRICKHFDIQLNPYDPKYWNKYINKQSHIMKPLCKHYRVPYTIDSTKPFISTRSGESVV